MDNGRKLLIAQRVLQSLEDQLEQLSIEARIAAKIHDDKAGEHLRKSLIDLEKKVEAANQVIKEIEDAGSADVSKPA